MGSPTDLVLNPDSQGIALSDLRLYKRALTVDEVCVLANLAQPVPPSLSAGLLAWYDFSDSLHLGANHATNVTTAHVHSKGWASSALCTVSNASLLDLRASDASKLSQLTGSDA